MKPTTMMSCYENGMRLTAIEVERIASWTKAHIEKVHEGHDRGWADFAIRKLEGSIIGCTIVTCERCDEVKVRSENSCDVTDYECA